MKRRRVSRAPRVSRACRDREHVTLDLEAMASSGQAVATWQGQRVSVAGGLPGEQVLVAIEPGRRPRGRVVEVVRPEAERVVPACDLAERCGGCDWMHASRRLRARMHRDEISRLLASEVSISHHPVGPELGYRDRARLFVRARGRAVDVGYRAAQSSELVALKRCPVLHPGLAEAIGHLESALGASHGEGEAQIARGRDGLPVVELSFRGQLAGSVFGAFDGLVREGAWAGARIWPEGATAPALYGDPRPVVHSADGPLFIAPGGFSQPSEAAAAALGTHVAAATAGADAIVELFAGSGTLTVMAARGVRAYVAVESNPEAVEALRDNLAARGLAARCVVGDANDHRIGQADLVLLDPPRIGAAGAVARILEARPRRVVYVSCNPVTLARDLRALAQRYRIDEVALFDVFPQTSHVETVATLVKRRDGPIP